MVDKSEFKDHADLSKDPEILSMLDKARNGKRAYFLHEIFIITCIERIVFSGKVIKYNRFGMKQDRTILLTNLNLYNIKKKGKLNAWLADMHFSFPEKDTYPEAEGCHDVNYPG